MIQALEALKDQQLQFSNEKQEKEDKKLAS